MLDPNQEGENSRDNEQPNTNRGKYYYQDKPSDNLEEITQEDIRSTKSNKGFQDDVNPHGRRKGEIPS